MVQLAPNKVVLGFRPEYCYFKNGDLHLAPIMLAWLCSTTEGGWLWDDKFIDDSDDVELTFFFGDKQDAVLFKLTWGGI